MGCDMILHFQVGPKCFSNLQGGVSGCRTVSGIGRNDSRGVVHMDVINELHYDSLLLVG